MEAGWDGRVDGPEGAKIYLVVYGTIMFVMCIVKNNRTKMVLFIVDLSGKGNCDVGWSIVVKRIDTYENNVLKMLRDFQLFREC